MVVGNLLGGKLAEIFSPIYAVLISLILMVIVLISNTFLADDKIAILILTFIISMVAFTLSTPIQLAMIHTAKGSEMLGSSMNQSAFNMGNAFGAFFAGIPIAMGFGFTSATLVGAVMAGSGVIIAIVIIMMRKRRENLVVSGEF